MLPRRAAREGKACENPQVLPLPPRSQDLNPLDYGFWAEVNKRMRRQEARLCARKAETMAQYLGRPRHAARRAPTECLKAPRLGP